MTTHLKYLLKEHFHKEIVNEEGIHNVTNRQRRAILLERNNSDCTLIRKPTRIFLKKCLLLIHMRNNRSWTKFQMEEHQLSTKALRWKLRPVVISDPGTCGKIEKTTPSKQFTLADVSLTSI